jgi:hypothetical protein
MLLRLPRTSRTRSGIGFGKSDCTHALLISGLLRPKDLVMTKRSDQLLEEYYATSDNDWEPVYAVQKQLTEAVLACQKVRNARWEAYMKAVNYEAGGIDDTY